MRLTSGSAASARMRAERGVDRGVVAIALHPGEALQLGLLHLGPDAQDLGLLVAALGGHVHADEEMAAVVELALELVGGLRDLALEPTRLDGAEHAFEERAVAEPVEVVEHGLGLALHLVGELLDEPRAAERVGHVRDAGLVGDDLLGPQRQAGRVVGREREHLVHRVRVEALRAAEDAGERFDRGADDVDLGLLRGQRHARGLGVEPELERALGPGAVPVAHPPGPDATRGPVLGDLLEEVDVRVEEEGQAGRELVDREPCRRPGLDVREPVRQRERELLGGGAPGLADVVPGHRDRVPARHLGGAEAHRVGDDPHRRAGREDELLLRLVLLEDVVLEGAAELPPRRAATLGHRDVHREQDRGRRVDRHRRRDLRRGRCSR